MNAEHKNTRQPHDRDAVVTYTRVSPERRPKRSVRRAPAEDVAPEMTLDGAEVPSVDPGERVAFDFSADERHPRSNHVIDDLVADNRRPNRLRFGLVGASLAVIAGVGILAATVGVATVLPGSSQDETSDVPALAYNSPDTDAERALTAGSVREIPMSSGAPEAALRTEVAPPIPRPRPEGVLARAEPEPKAAARSSEPAPQSAGADEAVPAASGVAIAPAAPVVAVPQSGGTDSLITSIEETLARIDSEAPAASSEMPAQPPAPSPPLVTAPPVYPPAAVAPLPGTAETVSPSWDVSPPPATVDGYGGYSTGPVPPEPVPDLYPQAPQLNPATPGLYPSAPYAFPPPEAIEETEGRRPGLLRRTFTKATGAVGRVFARN